MLAFDNSNLWSSPLTWFIGWVLKLLLYYGNFIAEASSSWAIELILTSSSGSEELSGPLGFASLLDYLSHLTHSLSNHFDGTLKKQNPPILDQLLGIYEVLPAEGLGSSPYGDLEGIEGLVEVNYLSLPCDCSSRLSHLNWGCMYVPNRKASLTSVMLVELKPVKLLALAASNSSWVSILMTH